MRTPRVAAAAALLVLAVTACASEGGDPDIDDEAAADELPTARDELPAEPAEQAEDPALQVVAKLAPIADLVERVGDGRVELSRLVPPGADSHTYEPRPGDFRLLADADAFFGVGLDLNDAAMELAAGTLSDEAIVALAEQFLDEELLVFDHVHDDADHVHDGEDDVHPHDGQETGANPHVWTGLPQAAVLVDGIQQVLAELDPDGADRYEQAAARLRNEIEELDAAIAEAVETIPEEHRTLVVYHDAWSYFARTYSLEMVTAVQPSDFAEPSAGEVGAIIDLIREHETPALFGSEVFPSDVLDAIAAETGATYVGELADDTLPGEPGDAEHSYLGMMRRNATLIVDALGGDASKIRP